MDTEQIERLLAEDSYTKTVVVGVLAKDCLPKPDIQRRSCATLKRAINIDNTGSACFSPMTGVENIFTLTASHLDKGNSCISF